MLERLKMQFAADQQLEQEVTRRFFPRHWRSIARTSTLLRMAGSQAFGDRFEAMVNQTLPPRVVRSPAAGSSFWLVQHPADNTVVRLQGEVPLDLYGFVRLDGVQGNGLLVDIGANIGDQAIVAMQLRPTRQVVAIEPIPTTYFYLLWNLLINGVPLITRSELGRADAPGVLPLNAAVSADKNLRADKHLRSTVEVVWADGHSQEAGLKSAISPKYGLRRSARVPVVHLPTMLKGHTIDLLKLDCEGCELELLGGAPRWFANRSLIRYVGAEIHVYAGLRRRSGETHFAKANQTRARRARAALDNRGCKWEEGIVRCR